MHPLFKTVGPSINRLAASVVFGFTAVVGALAADTSLPSSFKRQTISSPAGAEIFVRSGGSGPAVVLLHGFGDTSDMWGPLAVVLAKTHTVLIPDLRGMGQSSHAAGGYDKRTQAADIRAVVTALGFDHTAVVGHDIGNMVAFAYAARYPDKVDRIVFMDAPIPGIGPWDEILKTPLLWHFNFGGPDMERLVQGRERIYLDRFWNDFAADSAKIDEATREHYAALYALPGGMRSSFAQFRSFTQDAADNRSPATPKLTMPVLAVGGEKSFGGMMAVVMRAAATDVHEAIVPAAGHWVMEENPAFVVPLLRDFLGQPKP